MNAALVDFDLLGLQTQFSRWGEKPSHALRLLRSFYLSGGQVDFQSLRLPRTLQQRLGAELPLRRSRVAAQTRSADGTLKLLIGFEGPAGDGGGAATGAVEAVLMPSDRPDRAAGCVSSQIGCAMSCDFCASTRGGLERNLDAGEIVEQFLHLREQALMSGRRLHTLVFMGMGEPLQNLENVITAIRRIAGETLGALGWRQITVSTVGLVPGMDRLAEADLNVHLALSLHAPDDETRSRLVPSNQRYPVAEIMAAARRFERRSGRIPTIEYCLLGGVNDSDAQARQLAALMAGFRAHVNLIPYNPIGRGLSGAVYEKPSVQRRDAFLSILRGAGVVAHVRRARGDDVHAACGQLHATLA